MKSAVFYGKHELRMAESPMPSVGKKDVLIHVRACGMCGTDVHIYEGDKGAADTNPPTILGHEFAGEIVEIGEEVTGIKVGDRVCVDPNKMCGECDYCRNGLGHFCENMVGIGTTRDGGFAEYCSVPESQVHKLSDEISYEEGAMTEPLSCCLHGIDMCELKSGCTVLVIGGGLIGQLMIQLAKLHGAQKVILSEPVESKRELGKRMGADLCIDPVHEDIKAVLAEKGISRIEAVIECAGLKATINQAIELAGKKSVVMMFGLTKPDEEISVKPFTLFQKEVVLKASYINPYTQGRALSLINNHKIDVKSLIYQVLPLEKFPEIVGNPAERAKGKYIFKP